MALTTEEIRVKAGLDYSKVSSGLKGMENKVASAAKNIARQFAGMFAAGAAIAQIKSVIDSVEQLSQRAEALEVSKSFLQDMENIGKAAGKSSEQMQQLITKFALKVEPGQNIQEEFFKFLDTLKNITDPAERAKVAFDRLGKSGIILLDVAKDGAEGFKKLAKEFDKLADSEIQALLKADAALDKFGNRVTIVTGKLIALLMKLGDMKNPDLYNIFSGSAFENLSAQERIAEMKAKADAQAAKKAAEAAAKKPEEPVIPGQNEEVADLRQEIAEAEETIANFKREYKGDAPLGSTEEYYEEKAHYLKALATKQESLRRIGEIIKERGVVQPVAVRAIGVKGYMEGVKGRATNWQDHVNAVNGFGRPVIPETPPIDPEKFVQKVRIVEIDE